ncbi:MAG TPA: glycosyltransferase family 4 protein [Acidimicrobiales bacterium]|nr:glycosyltransferase family 4 protein [Acidimicrobiales bacterium]
MARPLRVAHIITKLAVGGAQESALVTLTGLDAEAFDQWLVCGTEVDDEGSLRPAADEAGVRVVDVPCLVRAVSPVADLRAVAALRDHFRRERPDIVHTHSSKAGFIGRAAARSAGIPVVVHSVHGWSFHPEMRPSLRRAVVAAERIAARGTTVLVHEGVPDRAKGLDQGIGDPGQYVLVRNGIDLGAFSAEVDDVEPGQVRRSLGVPDGAWLLGTVGRLADQKAPLAMVDAVAPLMKGSRDLWFVWVGDGPLRDAVAEKAAALGIAPRFRLAGVRRDVPAVLRAMDTFVLSSLWEGLPRTVTEAMASSVPVVATAVDGVAEVVDDGVSGLLVPPHDAGALGRAIQRVREDDGLRARLAAAGVGRAQEFDRSEMLRRLADLYRGLAGGSTPAEVAAGWSSTPAWS